MEKKRRQLTPEQDALEHIVSRKDKPFLEERFIDSSKGRGVFTHKAIKPSTFVVEYRGNIVSQKDASSRKKCGDTLNNFLFEFSWKGAQWCVDASNEDRTLGRLVNDDHISPNCEMKKVVYEGKPHLCLFAVKEISPGEEITYNYGDSSYPWRSADSCDGSSTSNTEFNATSSTPRTEGDSAGSSFEKSCSDDDELPDSGPSQDNDSFANTNCQLEDEAAFSSDEEYVPSRPVRKPKDTSYTIKNYCYVCGKGFTKIARHLLRHSNEEPEIAEAFAFPKFSQERKRLLDVLRNKGNYKHNQEVLKNKSGPLKLKRRPTSTASAKTYVHCLYCKGMFQRKEMWRHVARCQSKTTSNSATGDKTRILSEIALAESPFTQKLPSGVWKMLLTMNQDEIAFAVQNDFLIIQLAQYLCEKYRNNPNKHDYIRQKLREMGRLLLALHKKSVFSLEDAIKPRNFYKVVEAVKDIAGFNEKLQGYNKPTLALKLGHSLKKIGTIVLSKHDCNEQMISDTKKFMKLCAKEWSELVSHTALASLSGQKVNNPSTIPFTRDVQNFYKYLETTSASAAENLTVNESPQVYSALCRVILAQASVLNKCAPEVSKMTLKTFQERDDATRVLSKHFIRINIEKMTGQNVPVLLTSDLVSALTLLVSKRKACGVHQDNPYLFAKPDASPTSLFHGRICIRAFSRLCRAKNPEHLRSVHLHKHIARVFQILNLENDELDHLAKLLGHDIRADRDYYRLPEAAVDLAKIAKLLLAMEKGSLERFKGNSLEEIEIEDELEPDVEQGNSENSDAEEENEESDLSCQQSDAVEQEGMQLSPEKDALEHIKACRDKGFLEERFIDPIKGRGVFTHQPIEPSTFVVEYRGIISAISHKETRTKKCGDNLKSYLFDFSWIGTNWRVDASKEDGTLGRLVNDDHISPNCEMRKVVYEGKPHLCLFAVKEISPGEEITYNYGDSSYPWRSAGEDSAGSSTSAESCSDDDYVPESESSRDDGPKNNNPDPDSTEQQSFVQQPVDASCIQQESEDDNSSDDFTSDGEPEGTSRTNKNYCYVCGKAQSKISRHLFTHRNEEDEIAEVFALPLYSKERNILLDKLRNRGNYKHNQIVLKTHCGELKVKRRKSNMSTAVKTFALCLYCKGMFSRKDMWRHMQRCASNKSSKLPGVGKSKVLTLIAAAESTDLEEISSDVREILTKMKKDEIASVIESDPHILLLARCLCHMNESKTNRRDYIAHRLRLMGRLLLKLRTKSISSFEDAVKPQNFSKVVEAVRDLAGFNEEMKSCDRPSLMLKMGNSLKKIGQIVFARALKEEADEETTHEAETFMKLCAEEWSYVVKTKSRVKKPQTISFIQDVQLFYQCMEKTAASAVESLTLYESPPVYNALLRVTAAQVSLLNRNNVEISSVTLKSFKERDETELHGDDAVYQSEFEQILSKNTVKLNLRNNKGKNVAVTLTHKLLSAITLLVNKREACGVHNNNPFLFARPVAICTSFYHGHQCINTFVARCDAKNPANLRSPFFRRHVARVFQILSLTNDELDQLAKLLSRDIRTDGEYYQTPEAAVDIAKILALLSAMENECLERFEGKSLEEIEVADELELDVEPDSLENSDAEDNEEPESSCQLGDVKSGRDIGQEKATTSKDCSSFSRAKKPSRVSRVSSARKRGRGKSKRHGGQDEESEPIDEKTDEVNAEKDDGPEEMPASCAVNTPKETLSCTKEDAADICFSDFDEDMNVDFDMDTDEDIPRNEEEDGEGDTNGSAATPKNDSSPNSVMSDADLDETMDIDTQNHEDEKKVGKQNNWTDVESRSPSAIFDTGKKNKLAAAVTGMKEVKIFIPKLDIEKLQTSVHISQLSSVCSSVKRPVTDQPIQDNSHRCLTSSTATDINNKPSCAKAVEMTCSHCKTTMLKGQTAYQKKGFMDVFCSKNCLFEMFPINKPVPKTCYYCHKAISQPLDLIMAAVDVKGTMKDFCSVTCLTSFKSPPQSSCSMCNKSCTTTCELTLNKAVHKFCSDSCLENFRTDNVGICENCNSSCYKPLMLMLEEETKRICKEECLDEFKEKIQTFHQCTMCQTSRPMSEMVHHKSDENTVELFCTRTCVTSYTLRPAIVRNLQGKQGSDVLKKKKKYKPLNATLIIKDAKTTSDPAVKQSDSSAADLDTPTLVITDSCVLCCHCGKKLPKGQTLYQPKNSPEVFCSSSCLSERHPSIKVATKNCYNCFQVILRPHNMILAPVDDSGTMKELCSNTCLSSVNSKREMAAPKPPPLAGPRSECRMCAKYCFCKFKLNLDGVMYRICSDACFITYHKVNNLPLFACDVCSSVCDDKRFMLKMDDASKTICSAECLVKFKEEIETPQLCPMCQTSHQMSDMVENENDEGMLDFFCSNRCMVVHKAQSLTVSDRNCPSSAENDVKEVKPPLPNLDFIKEEPIDDEYNQDLSSSISTENIKDEPNVVKEELKICSVFSLKGDTLSHSPSLTHMDLPASCSSCKKVLMDGETVYQRKQHADIFCSTPCLLKFYQIKQVRKTCHFCLQAITQNEDVLPAPVDTDGTMKDFCSQTCLSSFNYRRIMSTKIPIAPVASHSQCGMCSRYCISKHEIIQQDVVHKICSDPCFLRFCNMNNLSVCENCRSSCNRPLILQMEDGRKKLCNAECLAQFKRKITTPQPCAMCCNSHLMSDMVENKNGEGTVELFCSSSCVMASKIQAVSASGIPLNCDNNCGKTTLPACHLAMSDASIRNFCSLTCAMAFKESQKDMKSATSPTGAPDQTQGDFLKPPGKLPCAQCRRIIKAAPQVVQKKGKMNFVCSLACSQEFKRVNNIMGKCEHCKNERIIRDAKRVNGKDCYFCSDGCKTLFQHDLEKQWGEHCSSCAYCLSISQTVVTAQFKGTKEEFCSEECSSNYKMLFCHIAKCDTCGHEGKLRQSLPMLGEVKHFCDLKCLLHFCNKKVQMVNAVSSPPGSAGATESSPVIANVISLAGALARQPSASAQHVSLPDIQTKVVGHASIQTVPKELKNKSMLCTPLVHNKGVSCTTQTVDTEAQTDNFEPTVIVLPVPVPMYVPLPMNMYSQYTPKPVGLPLPLPVPIFLPVTSDSVDPTVKSMKESIQPDPSKGELNLKSEKKKTQDKRNESEDRQKERVMTKEGQRQEIHTAKELTVNCSNLDKDREATLNSWEDSSDTSRPHNHEKPPSVLEEGMPVEPQPEILPPAPPLALEMREDPQSPPSPAPAPPVVQQPVGKVHNKKRLHQFTKAAKEKTSQRGFSKTVSRKHHKLKSQSGIDAWKRWVQWRKSQTNLGLVSSHAVTLKEDVLHCSAAELSSSLCCFITEVKQPDGEPYSPDGLFYLCLSIQKHLFGNDRMENIFSDQMYSKFSTEFTKILKGFKPSIAASGYIHSHVEEEFLWDCKQLGAYSPIVLLNSLLFFCCKYFGFTTVEQHRQLSFAHIVNCNKTNENNTETSFLRFYRSISINESDADGVPAKKRKKRESKEEVLEMMENTENLLRCPVRLYEFYLSKCSESVKQCTDLFYLQPDPGCIPSSRLWFSSTPLDNSTMEAMLVRILATRELQGGGGRGVDQQAPDDALFISDEEDSK